VPSKVIGTTKRNCVFSHNFTFHSLYKYRVIKKDGLNFARLYFLNCTWYVNDLHNI